MKSTAWPPGRSTGAFSTTVTVWPERLGQWASAGPAMLAPEMRTVVFCMVTNFGESADSSPTIG
ncbi:hypothetical protein [Streptosporangium sp. NBC_01810]|uniref:hypothetical protein n=1 Tax=Streptosporangium sp. NBC_01810 TaxID=2975951 RepID=UPI003FA35832